MSKLSRNIQIDIKNLKDMHGIGVSIQRHSPGDGWSRYSVDIESPVRWSGYANSMDKKQCESFLAGMYAMGRLQNYIGYDWHNGITGDEISIAFENFSRALRDGNKDAITALRPFFNQGVVNG